MKLTTKLALAAAASLALAAGCAHHENDPKMENGIFKTQSEDRAPTEFVEAQAAAGAREDGMLYERHFDGDQLNSLGRAKLDLMAERDDTTQPVTIHLVTRNEKLSIRRHEAITNYLRDSGLKNEDIRFVNGPNEDALHPAQPGLDNMAKTDTSEASGAPAGGSSPAAEPTSGAPMTSPGK